MIKLRKPFSQKIHLHIRQNMLQQLWDKYVPASSSAYEQIQLVYLKGALGEMEKQPEQVQLLIQLILKNKMMQLNLMQYPALVKVGQTQMERRLRQIERFYTAQLKSCDFTMFRTVRHYFALLDQAEESSRRYQSWLKDYQEIEKQREEYRLLSLFSVKLQELLTERSVNTLQTMEREFVDSLSETEYRALAEELIWQEKPELIAYLKTCNQTQCEEIFRTLEKDIRAKEVLSSVVQQPVKEKLIAVAEQLGQQEFCLFYHQVTELEDVSPQMVIWKESRTQMLHAIDTLESGMIQQVWKQIEEVAHPLEQTILQMQGKEISEQNTVQMLEKDVLIQNMLQVQEKVAQFVNQSTVRIQENSVIGQDALQTLEKELVHSLSETEYQTFTEELIWQEKPSFITYLEECNTAQCEEIVNVLEKDTQMREILALVSTQPVKEKLITAVEQMGQKAFCLFYHQVEKMEDVNPQVMIWKESKTEMLHSIDHLETETLQQVWSQIETVALMLEQDVLRIQEQNRFGQNMLRIVHSLSETEYQSLIEELIWQEKPELIAYLNECTIAQCEEIVRELEKDVHMSEVLSLVSEQPVKEKLIAAAEQLEQKEFCLFYHQVMKVEDISPQMVIWKESKTEMLDVINRMTNTVMETERLQQIWNQVEKIRHVLGFDILHVSENDILKQNILWEQENSVLEQGTLRVPENSVLEQDALRIREKELVYSLLETEYQAFAEELIWKEKPEFVAYLKECSKARCKEIVKALEKDIQITEVLSSVQKQSVRKRLVAAVRKLKQPEFGRFYWQVVELKGVNPPIIIWKKNRTEMLHSFDEMKAERLQEAWVQMEAAAPVKGMKVIFSEKIQHLQNQYQQKEIQNVQEQITAILKENDLERITDIVNVEQLIQDAGTVEAMEKGLTEHTKETELLFENRSQLTMRDEVYQVIQKLEQEREIRRNRVDRQQAQVVETYQEAYAQILETEDDLLQQQENVERLVEQTFLERHQERFTREEIRDIREWSRGFLEACFAEQESSGASDWIQSENQNDNLKEIQDDNQGDRSELIHMVEQINYYMEEQYGSKETLILNWQESFLKDERIQKVLASVRKMEKEQKQKLTQYLADMMVIWQEVTISERVLPNRETNTQQLPDRTELAQLFEQESAMRELLMQESRIQELSSQKELLQEEFLQEGFLRESLIQGNTYEFAEKVLRIGDRELARELLQIENRRFAEKLLQIGDREIVRRFLQVENREVVENLLQDNDISMPDVSYRNLWEWGETLLLHPEHQQEDADIISVSQQDVVSADDARQEDMQTQVIRHQIAMAKDRNNLQRLIRQINHQADAQLVYADAQLKLPQVQALLHYIRQLDEKQYGVLVKELAQITKIQKMPYDKPKTMAEAHTEVEVKAEKSPAKTRNIPYPILVQRIHDYEKQHRLELYREIGKTEQKIFPKVHEKAYEVTSYKEGEKEYEYGRTSYERVETEYEFLTHEELRLQYELIPYEKMRTEYGFLPHEEISTEHGLIPYEKMRTEYGFIPYERIIGIEYGRTPYERTRAEYGFMPYEEAGTEYGRTSYEGIGMEYGKTPYGAELFEAFEREYAPVTAYEKTRQENKFQPQKLEYSTQKALSSEEDQRRNELRMQQETAQIKSVQEQLDKKLKEVESQLKKVEDSTKAKEDVGVFAEQVKRQLYEELHVEKLRRGLV